MLSGAILTGDVVRLLYPHPEFYTCLYCYAGESTAQMQGSGRYKLHSSLMKHLKHIHPAAKVEWGCPDRSSIGRGHCPLKSVKEHFGKHHSARQSTVRVAATTASPVTRTDNAVTATTAMTITTITRNAATTTTTIGTTAAAGPSRQPPFAQQRSDFPTAPGSLSLQRHRPMQKTLNWTATTRTATTTVTETTCNLLDGT